MRIVSLASRLPTRIMTNEDVLREAVERNSGNLSRTDLDVLKSELSGILTRLGAETRYRRAPNELALDLGTAAANHALAKASLRAEDIDLLIYVGVGRGFLEPATANAFQQSANLVNATCFDVLDACASWIRGLVITNSLLETEKYRYAMLLNCEFNCEEYYPVLTSLDQLEDVLAGYTIGEAATATIVSSEPSEFYSVFRNVGQGLSLCQIPLPNARQFSKIAGSSPWKPLQFYAQPFALSSMAIRALSAQLRDDPRFAQQRFDVIFGHSIGLPITRKTSALLGLDPSLLYEIFPKFGNTVSASIPLAMSLAVDDGSLQPDHRILMLVGSAGVTAGAASLVF